MAATDIHRAIQEEREHRREMWQSILNLGGPTDVQPQILRELGIYGGAQGIWVDKRRTQHLTPDRTGVTVGLLHTGRSYADDLDEEGVIYHYPFTSRPLTRDEGEVAATRAANRLHLPVFVITPSQVAKTRRDVNLGWVHEWDDEQRLFLVMFGDEPATEFNHPTDPDAPFSLIEHVRRTRREVTERQGQQRFKFHVLSWYGGSCALCGIDVYEVLDAAHICPKREYGTDDPRNGLLLCALHHRAFDAGLFAIEPETLAIHCRRGGPDAGKLRMRYSTLQHLRQRPHTDALDWLWQRWSRQEASSSAS